MFNIYHKISGDSVSFYTHDYFSKFAQVIYDRVTISPKEVNKIDKGKVDCIKEIVMSLSQFRAYVIIQASIHVDLGLDLLIKEESMLIGERKRMIFRKQCTVAMKRNMG